MDLFVAEAAGLEVGGDGVEGFVDTEAVELAGVDETAVKRLVAVPVLPCFGGVGLALDGDDLTDRKTELFGEGEVALVVGGHAHHGALTVAHENVVGDPDLDVVARDRVADVEAGGHALLFHGGHVGFAHAALRAFLDKGLKVGAVAGDVGGERMLGGDRNEAHAHERVGAGRVDAQKLRGALEFVREGEVHAFGATDPVLLHAADLLGPALKLVEVVKEFLSILRDAEVVAGDLALFDDGTRAPAAAFNHLLVGKHGLVDGVPVDDLGLAVGDALLEHLEEHPLAPAVVFGLASGDFARPVEGEAERLHLALHVRDVRVRPGGGSNLLGDGGVFSRQAEGVPSHRGHHVVAFHAVEAVHHVVERVVTDVSHVKLAARVREHGADVELGFGLSVVVDRVLDGTVDVLGLPHGLDFGFHCLSRVSLAHNAFQRRGFKKRIIA